MNNGDVIEVGDSVIPLLPPEDSDPDWKHILNYAIITGRFGPGPFEITGIDRVESIDLRTNEIVEVRIYIWVQLDPARKPLRLNPAYFELVKRVAPELPVDFDQVPDEIIPELKSFVGEE